MSEPIQPSAPRINPPGRKEGDVWERWQRGVVQFLVLALKTISAAAIIALFAIAEYAAVKNVWRALAAETVNAAPQAVTGSCAVTSESEKTAAGRVGVGKEVLAPESGRNNAGKAGPGKR